MPAPLLNVASSQRFDLSDLLYLGQDQPTAMQAAVLGNFASRAAADQALYILHGFGATAGQGTSSTNPAQNQLLIAPGSGILAWRRDAGTPRFGMMADLDGTDQAAQSVDLTFQPSQTYQIWLRMTYTPSSQTDRTFWAAGDPGYEYSRLQPVRLTATWEVQALAQGSSPGAEWVAIAKVSWTAPTSQGGVGTLSNLQDTRPLYFEGNASSSQPFAASWGLGTNDRSTDRSTYGIGDLRTALAAMRRCLEDIKGPGLRRWYDASIGGLNIGFGPNTPSLGRVAVGDARFYLQGRTAAAPSDAYMVGQASTSDATYDGFHFGANATEWMVRGNSAPIAQVSKFGTFGVGNLAGTDLAAGPGRALAEFVTSADGQNALRLGARATNNAVPAGLSVSLHLAAPDQAGNSAYAMFSRGGVQGAEQRLFTLGKTPTNTFVLNDSVVGINFLEYTPSTRLLTLSGADFSYIDSTGNGIAFAYSASAKKTTFVQSMEIGGNLQVNSALNVNTNITGAFIHATGNATVDGAFNSTFSTASQFSIVNTSAKMAGNRLTVGASNGAPPSDAPYGTIYYDSGKGKFYGFGQFAFDNNLQDDQVGRGWRAL